MRIAIGIDVHKDKCALCALNADKEEPTPEQHRYLEFLNAGFRRFPSNIDGMQQLEAALGHANEVEILIENSTKSHNVYWMLTELGYLVTVAHATDLHLITKSRAKNDDRDAAKLAGYMRRKMNGEIEFAESFIVDKVWMERRELSRTMADLRTGLSVSKKKVRAHLLLHGLSTKNHYDDISTVSAMRELRAMNDPVLRFYVTDMEHKKKMISMMERTLMHIFQNNRMFEIVYSIPGFGVHSASYIVSQIVDINRFQKKTDLPGYAGMRPMQRDSADSLKNCCISRRGDPLMRRLAYQATFVHIHNCEDSFISEKYRRLRSRGKHHKEAVVACTNSMLSLVWTLIRNDTLYTTDPKTSAKARAAAAVIDMDTESMDELEGLGEATDTVASDRTPEGDE